MNVLQLRSLLAVFWLTTTLTAWGAPAPSPSPSPEEVNPSPRLVHLAQSLPEVGKAVDCKALGLGVAVSDQPPPPVGQQAPAYNFVIPRDLDRRSTDTPPYAGHYPGLHLNVPLVVQPSYINYLFISDQPERILDTREREWYHPEGTPVPDSSPPAPGATGVYARSPIPAKSTVRVLMDHSNETKRNLKLWLVWIPDNPGFLAVRKRSQTVRQDSVAAGSRSFADAAQVAVEPRQDEQSGVGLGLVEALLKPGETGVVQLEFFTSSSGQLASVITEESEAFPAQPTALDQTPILHSIVWKEEQQRLGKFIDQGSDPTRYNRILNSAQHARGHFQFPDRLARVDYKVGSWSEQGAPLQVYSLFESIPGTDVTAKDSTQDNRGKYGARNGLQITLKDLPQGCHEVALLAFNRTEAFGGRHWVSDGKRTAFETIFQTGGTNKLLGKGQIATLWRGPVAPGDVLTMWTEAVANTSVNMWYMLVPIPGGNS